MTILSFNSYNNNQLCWSTSIMKNLMVNASTPLQQGKSPCPWDKLDSMMTWTEKLDQNWKAEAEAVKEVLQTPLTYRAAPRKQRKNSQGAKWSTEVYRLTARFKGSKILPHYHSPMGYKTPGVQPLI